MGRSPDSASPGPPGDQGLPGLDGIRGIKTKTTNFYHVKKTLRLLGITVKQCIEVHRE